MPLDYTRGPDPRYAPYVVERSPSGAVVVCRRHIVSEGLKTNEAYALAAALNEEFQKRMTL